MKEYLQPGISSTARIRRYGLFPPSMRAAPTIAKKRLSLYYAVRDRIRYNPFQNFLADESYRGSACLERRIGWCVSKAALLAGLRARGGNPGARRFRRRQEPPHHAGAHAKMGTDLFVYHGYAELYLRRQVGEGDAGVHLSLCTKFRVKPLEFDGRTDSIFHPFDEDNRRHMEYLRDRGNFADVPAEDIKRVFAETYPRFYNLGPDAARQKFG